MADMSGVQPMQVDVIDVDHESGSVTSSVIAIDDLTTTDQTKPISDISKFPLREQVAAFLQEIGVKAAADRPSYIPQDAFTLVSHGAFSESPIKASSTLEGLSTILGIPGLTELFIKYFQPILVDLLARWITSTSSETPSEEWERKLFVVAELAQHVPEAWSAIHKFLEQSPFFKSSPLAFCPNDDAVVSLPADRLHLLLLSYFRILAADPLMGQRNGWKINPLKRLYLTHPDNGVKIMAISVFASQMGLPEPGRRKMEEEVLGQIGGVDGDMAYGWRLSAEESPAQTADSASHAPRSLEPWQTDAWVIRTMEYRRERRIARFSRDFVCATETTLSQTDLSSLVAIAGSELLFRRQEPTKDVNKLVHVKTAASEACVGQVAKSLALSLPTLISSPSSAGKTHVVNYLSTLMYPSTPLNSRVLTIALADTSIDAKALLGSYVSSPANPGTFTWTEGALTKAVRSGRWVILEDVDKAGQEVLSLFSKLADSMTMPKHVGSRASLDIPGRRSVEAGDGFALIAMRTVGSVAEKSLPPAIFLGHNYFAESLLDSPTAQDLQMILNFKHPRLSAFPAEVLVKTYHNLKETERLGSKVALPGSGAARGYGLRDLEKWCARVERMLPANIETAMHKEGDHLRFSNPVVQDEIFLEALDVFLAALPSSIYDKARGRREVIAEILSDSLGLGEERRDNLLNQRRPSLEVTGDTRARQSSTVRIGRASLHGLAPRPGAPAPASRPYALTKPSAILLERIAVSIASGEPALLVGETGTGKTTAVQYMATTLNRPLTAINLSTQTESSDLLGGFKPIDAAVTARQIYASWLELFRQTFSRKKNEKIEVVVRKAMSSRKWDQLVKVWMGTVPLAKHKLQERIHARGSSGESAITATGEIPEGNAPRKRRKLADDEVSKVELERQLAGWTALGQEISAFNLQHVKSTSRLVFSFVEGPLVQALRSGEWILLDEVNLASSETLEALSTILESPTSSVVLTERGDLEPVERHPDFRLFACMNPATDVGKKDLPPGLRARFTEIYAPPPDDDEEALRGIVKQYLGDAVAGDRAAIADVAEFYSSIKALARNKEIVDGTNTPPHFSMRTLARALTFAVEVSPSFGIRRGLWEGLLMTFTMSLDGPSYEIARKLCVDKILRSMRNAGARFGGKPAVPDPSRPDDFVLFGDYWLEKGAEPVVLDEKYIKTPSVANKLADLARIIMTRKLPVLIQGPTSSGKTSAVEYLAKQTGHRFVRINNHEHTDIQEYLGTYASDPLTGNLVFREGVLVTAVRNGYWLVLDELNLAPTDVLEALNRLLDDNRELVLPETGEVIRPHPHFMLFATQNPPGLYAGRKVLSRAFRNRFLEVHFDDVPQQELQEILHRRSDIAPTYAKLIVEVFRELQHRRQATRVFESRQSFATLRDLFRWAGREAISHQQLAENGYLLLGERARKDEDRLVVKEVLEKIIKAKIDEDALLRISLDASSAYSRLGFPLPESMSTSIVWTKAMQRLFTLVATAAANDEPILLVGETGSGKTSVCEVIASLLGRQLVQVSCHQNMETADLLGSQRPVRNRAVKLQQISSAITLLCQEVKVSQPPGDFSSIGGISELLLALSQDDRLAVAKSRLDELRSSLQQASALFEWSDGPLVQAMQNGSVLLLDELSLADDSVLERLNSVLEPAKILVLAEKGGASDLECTVTGQAGFQVIATMNPGGDFGKKELSPALRNRFTEIWVPAVTDRTDLEQIIQQSFHVDSLRGATPYILDFVNWFSEHIVDQAQTGMGLRDILAWVSFSNVCATSLGMSSAQIFIHAAKLVITDGLETLPSVAALGRDRLSEFRQRCDAKLEELAEQLEPDQRKGGSRVVGATAVSMSPTHFGIGPFSISKGTQNNSDSETFAMEAPTTMNNLLRVVRACQVPKSILLEGSPGVGKTSLVQALATACKRHLCRINLSDQTDLIDLFGSDLPVAGGSAGEFAWQDAAFLTAMQNGDWVLLDEMNLASQAVLEGLNAVLDHRGSVYVPELDRTFLKHPEFRLFAAQNPVQQGGGRKGLPKSFLNRFTKVYVQEHTPEDLVFICQRIFPSLDSALLKNVIRLNEKLYDATMIHRQFGQEGGPWEFNLRDIIRLFRLYLTRNGFEGEDGLAGFLRMVYVNRFRCLRDQEAVCRLILDLFGLEIDPSHRPWMYATRVYVQVGFAMLHRSSSPAFNSMRSLTQEQYQQCESLTKCIAAGWLAILVGPAGTGKRSAVRSIAGLASIQLYEYPMHSGVDTMEMLGTFEQSDPGRQLHLAADALAELLHSLELDTRTLSDDLQHVIQSLRRCDPLDFGKRTQVLADAHDACQYLASFGLPAERLLAVTALLQAASRPTGPSFEWIDGPLVAAIKQGHWFFINDANLCSPSVLDRLNSLCELNGTLSLNEKGSTSGQTEILRPHPNFRLFLSYDPLKGELSRAMRNRGIEVAFLRNSGSAETSNGLGTLTSTFLQQASEEAYNVLQVPGIETTGSPLDEASLARLVTGESITATCITERMISTGTAKSSGAWKRFAEVLDTEAVKEIAQSEHTILAAARNIARNVIDFLPMDLSLNPQFANFAPFRLFTRLVQLVAEIGKVRQHSLQQSQLSAPALNGGQVDAKSLRQLSTLAERLVQAGLNCLQSYRDRPDIADRHETNDEMEVLVGVLGQLCALLDSRTFQHAAVKVYIQLLQPLAVNLTDSGLALAIKELKSSVEPTTGLNQAIIWKALLTDDAQNVEAQVTQLMHGLRHIDTSQISIAGILQIAGLIKSRKLKAPQAEAEFSRLHQGLLSLAPLEAPEPVDFEIRVARGILTQLVAFAGVSSESSLISYCDLATKLDESSMAPLPAIMALRSSESSYASYFDMMSTYLKGLWIETGEGVNKEWVLQPGHLCQSSGLASIVAASVAADTRVGELDRYTMSRRIVSHALLWETENQQESTAQALSMLAFNALQMFANIVVLRSAKYTAPPSSVTQALDAISGIIGTTLQVPLNQGNALFVPYLSKASQIHQSRQMSETLKAGQTWILLGQTLINSFVPDVPLDPTVEERCQQKLKEAKRSRLNLELRAYTVAEQRITGNSSNRAINEIQVELQGIEAGIDPASSWNYDARSEKLQAFYQEVHRFLGHVMQPQKIDDLAHVLSSTGGKYEMSLAEEENFQAAAHAFVKRLEESYEDLQDLAQPVCVAVQAVRLGLRVIAQDAIRQLEEENAKHQVILVKQLTSFPSVSSLEGLAADRHDLQPSKETAGELLLQLRSINMRVNAGHIIASIAADVETLYSRISALWRVDQEAIKRQQQIAESLYRQRTTEEEVESDEAVEARELAELFPTYDGDEDLSKTTSTEARKGGFVKAEEIRGFYRSHLALFRLPDAHAEKRAWAVDRKNLVGRLLLQNRLAFDQVLDRNSRAYQLLAINDEHYGAAAVEADLQYNFYHSPNRTEITRALRILRRLRARLTVILEEWPDQIRLQHIIDRCDYTQAMPAESSVARMLSAMEQLLEVVQDWESYANRDNSLASFRDEIIALIIGWRKAELSAWNRLMDQEVIAYDSENAPWWFRLYELLIVGTNSAIETADSEMELKFREHLDSALPLITEYISATSCGHFGSRLRLLGSFADYIEITKLRSSGRGSEQWRSVMHLLHNIEASYGQYAEIVQQNISNQRAPLEKAVRDFIKLASWKDVNVNAMQASARKSHAQLYKTIRKFRDILRQPVTPFLGTPLPALPAWQSSRIVPVPIGERVSKSVKRPVEIETPTFLADANRTIAKYQRIMAAGGDLTSSACVTVEDLATDIIETVDAFSKETPANLTEENKKNVKNLQTRKRKAFSDLLKELRQLGFSAKVRADQLAKQSSAANILKLCPLDQEEASELSGQDLLKRVEQYHHRLDFALPAMRHALNDHSADIVTHDLQRAHGFAESAFAEALGTRKDLVDVAMVTKRLSAISRRFSKLADEGVAYAHRDLPVHIKQIQHCVLDLCDAGAESLQVIHAICSLREHQVEVYLRAATRLEAAFSNIQPYGSALGVVCSEIVRSGVMLLSKNEMTELNNLSQALSRHEEELVDSSNSVASLSFVIDPLVKMTQKAKAVIDSLPASLVTCDAVDIWSASDKVIEKMLIVAQSFGKEASNQDDQAEQPLCIASRMTLEEQKTTLRAVEVESQLCLFAEALATGPIDADDPQTILSAVQQLLPYLDTYVVKLNRYLMSHAAWSKALYKLDYVLVRTFTTLSSKGFCKPEEADNQQGSGQDGQMQMDGTGLGSGSGEQNVSNEIEDESQVEGLKGEDEEKDEDEPKDRDGDDEAVEMQDDFEGALDDVDQDDDEKKQEEGEDEDQEDKNDMDEHVGDVGEDAVDDQFWGDDEEDKKDDAGNDQLDKDQKQENGESEMAAREEEQSKGKDKPEPRDGEDDAEQETDNREDDKDGQEDEVPGEEEAPEEEDRGEDGAGAALDSTMPEVETLDLPEEMQLDDAEGSDQMEDFEDDGMEGEDVEDELNGSVPDEVEDDGDDSREENDADRGEAGDEEAKEDAQSMLPQDADDQGDSGETEAQNGVGAQGGLDNSDAKLDPEGSEPEARDQDQQQLDDVKEGQGAKSNAQQDVGTGDEAEMKQSAEGQGPADETAAAPDNSRSKGDLQNDVHRLINEILERSGDRQPQEQNGERDLKQVEHIQDDEKEDMQALGASHEEQQARLAELAIVDEDMPSAPDMDVMDTAENEDDLPSKSTAPPPAKQESAGASDSEKALTEAQISGQKDKAKNDLDMDVDLEDLDDASLEDGKPKATGDAPDSKDLELSMKRWVESGRTENGEEIWRKYSALTSDLSYHLCEQLRLILQPTLATRLQGDYRTGKRLNMRKIIPYIASEYTKDKIWLRRTKPSRREYQVLLSLDDSRSMADSHSVHLAYQTLALVSQALTKLEVGQVGIARFGEEVEMLHEFSDTAFSAADGAKVMNSFTFGQHKTDVAKLVSDSLDVLARARQTSVSSSSADLWQLEIIISDGVCQDHEKLRRLLRRAMEERVMIVFLVVDSLAQSAPAIPGAAPASRTSILNMQSAAYKEINGAMQLEMTRYLDTFPFEYFVVLRDVEALPEVLSETLRQWIARVAMSQE